MHTYRDSNGVDDHNGAAAMRTVELAKNLKHVRMLGCRPASSRELYLVRERPVTTWKGFVPSIDGRTGDAEGQEQEKTKLESLSFLGFSQPLNIATLETWEGIVDFSCLKSLTCKIGDEDFFRHVAASSTFPRLEHLDITLLPSVTDGMDNWRPSFEAFFGSLRPLTSLSISGALYDPLLDIIAEKYGEALEVLEVQPSRDFDDQGAVPLLRLTGPVIELLASKAPNLTTITLTLKRSMGDRTETRCYEALGTLKNLRHVNLNLDCSNPSQWNLSPEED